MTAKQHQWYDLPQLEPLTFDTTLANCRGLDPDLFHPPRGRNDLAAAAVAVCAGCQVIEPCRTYAIANNVTGIWGGTTGRDRRPLRAALPATPPAPPPQQEHGTYGGYQQHKRRNTEPCLDCCDALVAYKRAYKANKIARRNRARGAA
jgi:WhiB family transcriptional regulator, redox-sensing transcriptional regulator